MNLRIAPSGNGGIVQASMGDVFEFAIPCHPFNPQIRHLLSLDRNANFGCETRCDEQGESRRVPWLGKRAILSTVQIHGPMYWSLTAKRAKSA